MLSVGRVVQHPDRKSTVERFLTERRIEHVGLADQDVRVTSKVLVSYLDAVAEVQADDPPMLPPDDLNEAPGPATEVSKNRSVQICVGNASNSLPHSECVAFHRPADVL